MALARGKVYVGKSFDVERRIIEHESGSEFTKVYPPVGLLPRLGNVEGDCNIIERDETIRYMMERGVNNVRGWRFTRLQLSEEDFDDIDKEIKEILNLCRKCGRDDHFVSQCTIDDDDY